MMVIAWNNKNALTKIANGEVVLSYIYGITDLKGSSKDVIKQRIAISAVDKLSKI